MRIFAFVSGLFLSLCVFAQTPKEQAVAKIDSLNDMIAEAEGLGIDALRERSTVRTAEIFLDFADWDEANVVKNTELFGMTHGYKDKPEYWAGLLADFEREEVVKMLGESLRFLEKLIDSSYVRRPAKSLDWSQVMLEGDRLTYEGSPVFLLDYTWKPGIERLTEYHGNKDGFGIYPSWVQDSSGTMNSYRMSQLRDKENGRVGFIFIGNDNPPAWTSDAYGSSFRLNDFTAQFPEIYSSDVSRFTDYDIDNPGAKRMMGHLIDATVPLMSGKKYTEMGYMLCNEPHFFTTKTNDKPNWGSSPVTEHTIGKFKTWLAERHGEILVLNDLWGTDFASFESLTIDIPIATELTGTAMWYDWQLFNNFRVTEWYRWMKAKVQENDPLAKVHLKIMPNLWSENWRGHGIDFEALTEMSEIIGNDCSSDYNNVYSWKTIEWDKDYIWNWRELAMSYDFLKSVSPEKSMINSESHFLSTGSSRDLYMKPEYVKATAWLSHLKGLTYEQVWYWNRLEDGSPKTENKSHAASNNQQPRVINEITRTYMDLNAFGEEVMAFQRLRKPVRIFYSETSALCKTEHMDDVFEVYEELAFEGFPLGFATENIVEKQEHSNWDVIVVFKTEFVTDAEMEALQAYLNAGGTLIVDAVSLKKNEYGINQTALDEGAGMLITVSSLSDIKEETMSLLEAEELLPPVTLSEVNTGTTEGCMWNVIENEDGNRTLFVTNLGNTEALIDVQYRDETKQVQCKDLLKGIALPSQMRLDVYETLLIELSEFVDTVSVEHHEISGMDSGVSVFPTPFTSELNIRMEHADYDLLRVHSLNGQVLSDIELDGRKELTLNASELKVQPGVSILEFSGLGKRECLKVVRLLQ